MNTQDAQLFPVTAPVVTAPCCNSRAWTQSAAMSSFGGAASLYPVIPQPQVTPSNIPTANQIQIPDYSQPIQGGAQVPQNVTMVMPTITRTAQTVIPNPQPGLTPQDLVRPLPSITATAPLVLPPACDAVDGWIGQNPMMAVGILAGLAYLVFKGK